LLITGGITFLSGLATTVGAVAAKAPNSIGYTAMAIDLSGLSLMVMSLLFASRADRAFVGAMDLYNIHSHVETGTTTECPPMAN
jgi:hypothetical protein